MYAKCRETLVNLLRKLVISHEKDIDRADISSAYFII